MLHNRDFERLRELLVVRLDAEHIVTLAELDF
jgi:hypothetical protein